MGCAFTVDRNTFEQALFGIQNVAQKRTPTPILTNVRIEAKGERLRLYATDYDVGLSRELAATVKTPGSAALPARVLYDIVKKAAGDTVDLDVDDRQQGTLKTGARARYKLVGMNPEDFPEPTPVTASRNLRLPREMLRIWIRKTLFAASTDESRVSLAGVFVECYDTTHLRFVATDTHRLALVELPGLVEAGVLPAEGTILPRKALTELLRILDGDGDVELTFAPPFVRAAWEDTEFVFRTVDGRFPSYRTVIPESTGRVAVVSRQEFQQAIERVSLVVTDRFKCVTLKFGSDQLTLSARNPEMGEGEELIDCRFDGKPLEVGFNAQYLQEALTELSTEQVEIRLIDDVSPALLSGEGDKSYLNVIMPMRI